MSIQNIPNLINKGKELPDICANCKHNQWDEYGPQCRNEKNWKLDEDEDSLWMDDDWGNVEWNYCCDNHERGVPFS